ncbi:2-dehydro-3-deoxygluconokinase [Leifsonia xyli subsp. xyli]|uniref:2-dehydro-3-deoxygluconokinase n=2 Tax=Leifsonia xyli subsp. xyli TaxID=59736 RepID=Q6AHJ1_LEIXX|nr:sugar kinase [Leifsonia xyli]AAT88154.1 2-dehydro-3-deoxygluconokinase [Leifsonia xyli subsp. xyli str. CTCB07]ODA90962.1 2-dehydro-3-deoxygluconokinase [Leifsonia xyli subsp. xyli]
MEATAEQPRAGVPRTGLLATIGEAMVVLYPEDRRPLAEAHTYASAVGGAEYNVATSLARLGLPTAWISRLGADGLGDRILKTANEAGVDTSAVERDELRPTGLYLKETSDGPDGVRTRMRYYRRDSAAAALSNGLLRSAPAADLLGRASIVHTSGITPALSASAAEAMSDLRSAIGPQTIVSVDLNHRPLLWAGRETEPLDALIGQADILLLGRDEAEAYAGHADPERFFAANPRLGVLVVKDDARRASVYRRDGGETHVPCLTVEVVEPVGAGDAFASGFLCGLAEGRDDASALRLGHALAALTLIGHGDRPLTVPDNAQRDRIAAVPETEWAGWSVRPGEIPWNGA